MPNLKISQFTALATSAQSPTYILPLADAAVTNYGITLNNLFSNIGANTTTGRVTSTTTSTALSATNLGVLITRGDNLRSVQILINSDVLPAPQVLIASTVGTLEGDNINRVTFRKSDTGGLQAPSTATLGTIEYSNTTAVAASQEVRSIQSSGGNGVVQTWYTTRRNGVSLNGIFGIDNWGTFRVSRNLGPLYSDVQLSDPTKLMVVGNVDALNDTTNVCLHILNSTGATNQLNLLLQAVAGQSTNLFECKTSANVKTLQITAAGILSPGSAAGVDLAASALPFKDLYLAGSSGTPATNNFRITGTATAARVITLPDATCTLAASTSALTAGRLVYVAAGGLLTTSASGLFDGINLAIGTTIDATITGRFRNLNTVTSGGGYGLEGMQDSTPTSASTAFLAGVNASSIFRGSTVSSGAYNIAVAGSVTYSGTGTLGRNYGIYLTAANSSTGTVSDQTAALYLVDNTGGGTVTSARGGYVKITNSSGTITSAIGIEITNPTNSGTLTNNYGLIIRAQTAGSSNYSILAQGGTSVHTGVWNVGAEISGGQLNVTPSGAAIIGQVIRGAASQSADLTQWQNSAGTVLSGIDASGRFYAPTALTATTVGAAGGASALPATPTGYLLINVNGTQMKVPYFAT